MVEMLQDKPKEILNVLADSWHFVFESKKLQIFQK